MGIATCRFCKKSELEEHGHKLVKYGVRHYAHHACYLAAGKDLFDLHGWQIGQFPARLFKEHGIDMAKVMHAIRVEHRPGDPL